MIKLYVSKNSQQAVGLLLLWFYKWIWSCIKVKITCIFQQYLYSIYFISRCKTHFSIRECLILFEKVSKTLLEPKIFTDTTSERPSPTTPQLPEIETTRRLSTTADITAQTVITKLPEDIQKFENPENPSKPGKSYNLL